jgi:hypothetical protein
MMVASLPGEIIGRKAVVRGARRIELLLEMIKGESTKEGFVHTSISVLKSFITYRKLKF